MASPPPKSLAAGLGELGRLTAETAFVSVEIPDAVVSSKEANGAASAAATVPGEHNAAFQLPQLPHLPHLPHLPNLPQNLQNIAVFENGISYLLYLSAPLNVVMVTLGFLHKDDCPVDVRLPRYLFFGGLAGLMATLLRVIMELKWRSITRGRKDVRFNPSDHPGLGMVRTVMYIFLVFVVVWNVNATGHVFSVTADLDDSSSSSYCHRTTYWMAYVLVILFDSMAVTFFLVWVTAIVAGLCNPDFLVLHGYFPNTEEIGFKKLSPLKKKKGGKKDENAKSRKVLRKAHTIDSGIGAAAAKAVASNEDGETDEPKTVSVPSAVAPTESKSMMNLRKLREMRMRRATTAAAPPAVKAAASSENGDAKIAAVEAKGSSPESETSKPKMKITPLENSEDSYDASGGGSSSDEDDEGSDTFPEDQVVSIVRFAQKVNMRRISMDVGPASAGSPSASSPPAKMDITNFPSGPLFKQEDKNATDGGGEMEMQKRRE